MLFSSSVFLFAYLPIVLVVYYIPLRGLRRWSICFLWHTRNGCFSK